MGLAASNARWMSLIGRMSDLEYRGQQINQQRLAIASQEQQLAETYNTQLNQMKIVVNTIDQTNGGVVVAQNLSLAALASVNVSLWQYNTTTSSYNQVTTDPGSAVPTQGFLDGTYVTATNNQALASTNINSTTGLPVNQVGTIAGQPAYQFDWQSAQSSQTANGSSIQYVQDTTQEQIASDQYEASLAQLEPADKQLEMQLKDIDTQHQSVQTEMDAVKKVIDKNIEQSFKTFNA